MRTALTAGLAYGMLAFLAGAGLGALRRLLLVPLLGDVAATLLELPVMLALGWWLCGRLCRPVSPGMLRLVMGASALALLLGLEVMLALVVGDRLFATAAQWSGRGLGLAGQLLFAAFPWLRGRRG